MKKVLSFVLSLVIMATATCLPTFAADKTSAKPTATPIIVTQKADQKVTKAKTTTTQKVVKKAVVTHSLTGVIKSFDGKVIYLKSGRGTYHFKKLDAKIVGTKGIVVGAKATLVYSGTMGKNAKLVKVIMDYSK